MHRERTARDGRAMGTSRPPKTAAAAATDALDTRDTHNRIDRPFSPAVAAVSRGCLVYSPVTELALDFKDLSGFGETPKRRLSLTSVETPTPGLPLRQSPGAARSSNASDRRAEDANAGLCIPGVLEASVREASARTHDRTELKRIFSLPILDLEDKTPSLPRSPKCKRDVQSERSQVGTLASASDAFDCATMQKEGSHLSSYGSSSPVAAFRAILSPKERQIAESRISPIPLLWDVKIPSVEMNRSANLGASVFKQQHAGASKQGNADDRPLLQSKLCSTCDLDSDDDDDGYHDLCDTDHEGGIHMPGSIATLLTAPMTLTHTTADFTTTPSRKRSLFRSPSVPNLPRRRSRQCDGTAADRSRGAGSKRPDPPVCHGDDSDPVPLAAVKRPRPAADGSSLGGETSALSGGSNAADAAAREQADDTDSSASSYAILRQQSQIQLQRCKSMVEQSVHFYMTRTDDSVDMTGDLVTPCCLPLIKSKHGDLRCIAPITMAKVIRGEYRHVVSQYYIIDCRYPYEFASGHIQGAINLYSKDDIFEQFLKQPPALIQQPRGGEVNAAVGRSILIFHCEFSSERGPRLSRFLRNHDRQSNKEHYPWLYYPELYLLEGGYKAFFENYPELCEPQAYKPMLHPDHTAELRQCRQKSKSWCGGSGDGSGGAGSAGKRVPLRPSLTLSW